MFTFTTAYLWCDSHFISISVCMVWEVRAGVQVFRRELHAHIYLDQVKVEFISCIQKKKVYISLSLSLSLSLLHRSSTSMAKSPVAKILAIAFCCTLCVDSKIDWNALVKNTSTRIFDARDNRVFWRHLSYHQTLLDTF